MKKLILTFLLMFSLSCNADFYGNETLDLLTITKVEAFELFTFQNKFVQDKRVTIILPPSNSISFKTLAADIGKTPTSYLDIVQSKVHGGAAYPIWGESELEVIRKVASINQSIGYYHDKIAINTGFGIRIINVR